MNFTFGIVTSGTNDIFINQIIDSIQLMNIPNYEIIIVGNSLVKRKNVRIINFDELIKTGWITKKKNIITTEAAFDNIVYMHDYIVFDINWYNEFLKFGDFKICMNQILNFDGTRYRDWTLWPGNPIWPSNIKINNKECLLPYNITNLTKHMYISGAYWVAKKNVMENFPLNENLCWGQGEDVEWSFRVREVYDFSINHKSIVKLLKQKRTIFSLNKDIK